MLWLGGKEKWVSWNQLPEQSPLDTFYSQLSPGEICVAFLILAWSSKLEPEVHMGSGWFAGKRLEFSPQQGLALQRCLPDCRWWKSWDDGALRRGFILIWGEEPASAQEGGEGVVVCGKVCSQPGAHPEQPPPGQHGKAVRGEGCGRGGEDLSQLTLLLGFSLPCSAGAGKVYSASHGRSVIAELCLRWQRCYLSHSCGAQVCWLRRSKSRLILGHIHNALGISGILDKGNSEWN